MTHNMKNMINLIIQNHFNLRKTTGFFTSLSNYDFYNPRVAIKQ